MPLPGVNGPTLTYLIEWGNLSPPILPGNEYKRELIAAARAWYATEFPDLYPNTLNAMMYAYLWDNYTA